MKILFFSVVLTILTLTSCVPNNRNETDESNREQSAINPDLSNFPNQKQTEKFELADDKALLEIFTAIETEWKQAKITGNTEVLNKIFADEFINTSESGRNYSKTEWIKYLSGGNRYVKSFKITDVKIISRQADTATIKVKIITFFKDKKEPNLVYNDIDSFIYRDGRWQVFSSISFDETEN